jgi:hypothetical protein
VAPDDDRGVRLELFRLLAETGEPPSREQVASRAGVSEREVAQAYRRLHHTHAIVLDDHEELWMAAPFSAVPTGYVVHARGNEYFANCIWDAFGVVALLGEGEIETSCPDCGQPLDVSEGIGHFGVPAAHWWDDIGFT